MTEDRARRLVRGRSGGRCELLGRHAEATDYSHRYPRGRGGRWTPANALDLCRSCHAWLHANPALAVAGGWFIPTGQDPDKVPAYLDAVNGPGWWFLDQDGCMRWVDPANIEDGMDLTGPVPVRPTMLAIPAPRSPWQKSVGAHR